MWRYRVHVPNFPKGPVQGLCCTERTEVSGTGIDVVPISVPTLVQTCIPVPVLMYRTYLSVAYRYWCTELLPSVRYRWCCTELAKVSGSGIDVPNLPKCPVPVLLYRTYLSVRYRYYVPNLPKCPVSVKKTAVSLGTYRTEHTVHLYSQKWTIIDTKTAGTK